MFRINNKLKPKTLSDFDFIRSTFNIKCTKYKTNLNHE